MIGILDSGIGGVTVLKEIIKLIPKGHFIYYSDSINNPYGDKSEEEIYSIVKRIVLYFLENNCVAIVLACNTASCICVKRLREEFPKVLFIAIEPAYKMVHDYNPCGKTLVMATEGTLRSEKFLALYHNYDNNNTILLPCVGLADLIEKGDMNIVLKYLFDNLSQYKDVENVVLGCTHYPLIKNNIRKVLGEVNFFDGSKGVSKELLRQLKLSGVNYEYDDIKIDFIDSSNSSLKEKRFRNLLN